MIRIVPHKYRRKTREIIACKLLSLKKKRKPHLISCCCMRRFSDERTTQLKFEEPVVLSPSIILKR